MGNAARVAVVGSDPELRAQAAAAFDRAPSHWTVQIFETPPPEADVVVLCPDALDRAAAADAVAFDPGRPDFVLSEVQERLARSRGRAILVTGPSGGAGITTIATHLARALAGHSPTCLVDLDSRGGAATRLGVTTPGHQTWADLKGSGDLVPTAALPVPGGFRALLAPVDGGWDDGAVGRVVDRALRAFDRVVVDVPPTEIASVPARGCVGVAVVGPSPTAAARLARFLEPRSGLDWMVVINRLGAGGSMTRSAFEEASGHGVALELPPCPGLRHAEDQERLIAPNRTRWARGITRLARTLDRVMPG